MFTFIIVVNLRAYHGPLISGIVAVTCSLGTLLVVAGKVIQAVSESLNSVIISILIYILFEETAGNSNEGHLLAYLFPVPKNVGG